MPTLTPRPGADPRDPEDADIAKIRQREQREQLVTTYLRKVVPAAVAVEGER